MKRALNIIGHILDRVAGIALGLILLPLFVLLYLVKLFTKPIRLFNQK